MSMQLYKIGYKNITNIDYSEVVIEAGRNHFPQMEWVCDDIRYLANITSASYDVVLEKAILEALLVKENSPWSPPDVALETIDSVLRSVARVLTCDVSFTQPHFRVPAFLRQEKWSVSVKEFGEFFHYFVYIVQCGFDTSAEVKQRFAPEWSSKITAAQ